MEKKEGGTLKMAAAVAAGHGEGAGRRSAWRVACTVGGMYSG